MHPYDYHAGDWRFEVEVLETSSRSHYKLAFPSPAPAEWKDDNNVYGDLFVPRRDRPVPLVVITHGFGDTSLAPCMTLARLLVRQGIAALTWYLPFHSRRLPQALRGIYEPLTAAEWLEIYRSSVIELRRIIDWVSELKEIDRTRLAAAGISMGGIVSSIAMGVDSRISAGIFIVTGGHMEELSWGGKIEMLFTGHGCSREECAAVYAQYPAYLDEVAQKGIENVKPAKECFLFDPLTFAGNIGSRPVLMVCADRDEMVSEKSTRYLWEACGKPPLVRVTDSHVGTYCQSSLLSTEITRFMGSLSRSYSGTGGT